MLKNLFTSTARVKILTLFLTHPEEEFFVRELTRTLNEQINSVRRELDNLKKIGLLKSRNKARRKFYAVNKDFLLFNELKSIIAKANYSSDNLTKQITKMGSIDFLLISGQFLQKKSTVDLLIVGTPNKVELEKFLDELETDSPIKFSILDTKDFEYRLKYRDQFILDLIQDSENIIAVNKLSLELS